MDTTDDSSFNQNKTGPQVYSTYPQQDHSKNNQPGPVLKQKSNLTYTKNIQKTNDSTDQIKRQKYNAHENKDSNSINNTYSSDTSRNIETDPFIASCIGLNTFESKNVFVVDTNHMLVSLDHLLKSKKNLLCFKGKCSILLLHGYLGITGFNMKKELNDTNSHKWHDLFSPETNSFISILNKLDTTTKSQNLTPKESTLPILVNQINSIINGGNTSNDNNIRDLGSFLDDVSLKTTTLFLIRNQKSQMCDYISFIDNFQQVYNIKSADIKNLNTMDRSFAQFGMYPISDQGYKLIHSEAEEEQDIFKEIIEYKNNNKFLAINENTDSQVIMAIGGKDVGKSTFLRFMINSFLNKYKRVAYIDCDPGQSEFTLSGCISLTLVTEPIFGPPHTHINHNAITQSCYFFGQLSPSDAPRHYLECIIKCHEDFLKFQVNSNEKIPLVVNTMGWNQGLGLCLLKDILIQFKPSHVVQINHPIETNKNMPVIDKNWLVTQDAVLPKNKLSNLKQNRSNTKKNRSFHDYSMQSMNTDKDSSDLNDDESTEDYYKDITFKLLTLKSRAPSKTQNNQIKSPHKRYSPKDHRNLAVISYFSPLQDPNTYFQSIHNIRPYKVSWTKFGLHCAHAKIENNKLFHLFNASLVGLCVIDESHIKRHNDGLPGVLESDKTPIVYTCNGFGIIRGINMETKEFYILTPENPKNLSKVNLLVKGMLNLPYEFFYEQDSETSSPYMSLADHMQKQKENLIGSAPVQRKYLIHKAAN